MKKLAERVRSYLCGEGGQALIEYVFILILVAVVVILMLVTLGGGVNSMYSVVNNRYPSP